MLKQKKMLFPCKLILGHTQYWCRFKCVSLKTFSPVFPVPFPIPKVYYTRDDLTMLETGPLRTQLFTAHIWKLCLFFQKGKSVGDKCISLPESQNINLSNKSKNNLSSLSNYDWLCIYKELKYIFSSGFKWKQFLVRKIFLFVSSENSENCIFSALSDWA